MTSKPPTSHATQAEEHVLAYLNFSSGTPDSKAQQNLNQLFVEAETPEKGGSPETAWERLGELLLARAFDHSTVLMAGLNWVDWIYRQRRTFENRQAIPGRLDDILARLNRLCGE